MKRQPDLAKALIASLEQHVSEHAPERFEIKRFGGVHVERWTWGVMAYATHPKGEIPLGIDAHWHSRELAEIAMDNYVHHRVDHGRTTQHEHKLAFEHAMNGGD